MSRAEQTVADRYAAGWGPRRDGCGFLMWNRRNEWQSMTNEEAAVLWATGKVG